jgi:cytochrome b561
MPRYHPAIVVLHWVTALMVIGLLIVGVGVLEDMPNSDPAKVRMLMFHMIGGMLVLVLMVVRIGFRWGTSAPPKALTGNALLDRVADWAHVALYVLVITMSVSGFAFSRMAGLPDIVFGGSGAPLPENFNAYWPRAVHGLAGTLLMGLIALHVAAAFWHQWVRKDRLLARMTLGGRGRG